MDRLRDPSYLSHIRQMPCLVCGRSPSEAHHLLRGRERGVSLKAGDDWVVPLCNQHHRQLHEDGNEEIFFALEGVNAYRKAVSLRENYMKEKET